MGGGMSKTVYDDTLNDDAAHTDVIRAREAGRAWAEREHEATGSGEWYAVDSDARALVAFPPAADVEDMHERELELARICNRAARERWEEMTAEEVEA